MNTVQSVKMAVIGAGQLGSRHLQALGRTRYECDIYIVDPDANSLRMALDRFNDFNPGFSGNVTALNKSIYLPKDIDLAIVATTSNVRLAALSDLIGNSCINNLIIEKVLFQDLDHYKEAEKLLQGLLDRTWVNFAQRLWPFFKEVKTRFGGQRELEVVVEGSNWGLGCNSVHNADIAAFLWSGALTHKAYLDPVLSESKRPGFKEFTGELITWANEGGRVRQVSYGTGTAPFRVSVFHPTAHLIWDVATGALIESNAESNWDWIRRDIRAPYQSDLTTQIVENILAGKDCELTDYKTAANLHVGVLQALLDGARCNGVDLGNICPVT